MKILINSISELMSHNKNLYNIINMNNEKQLKQQLKKQIKKIF